MEGIEFVRSGTIRTYCKPLKLNFNNSLKYLISRGYLIRIFRGIFYIKHLDELEFGRTKYNSFELVAKGMELKGVKHWYFGLYTALKLNNMTHEHFIMDCVINDKIFRAKPIGIAGYKFRFLKLKPKLMRFGVVKNELRYSDPEKTILDFIYIWRYNGVPEEKIIMDISEYVANLSETKIKKYAENYPKTVGKIMVAAKITERGK